MLSLTFVGDFLGIVRVQATGAEIGALATILEAIVMSMGYSYTTTADINSAANGASYMMNHVPADTANADFVGASALKSLLSSNPAEIILTESMRIFMTKYVQNHMFSHAAYTILPPSEVTLAYRNVSDFESLMAPYKLTQYNSTDKKDYPAHFDSTYNDRSFVVFGVNNGAQLEVYMPVSKNARLIYDAETRTCKVTGDYPRAWYYFYFNSTGDGTYGSSSAYGYPLTHFQQLTSIKTKTDIVGISVAPGTSVYPSQLAYDMYNYVDTAFSITGKMRGSSANTKDLPYDDTAGGYPVDLTAPSVTQNVETAVNTAVTANPDITDDELDTIVTGVIADSRTDNPTGDGGSGSLDIMRMLTDIMTVAKSNALKLDGLTDGSSALDITGITDAFKVIEGGGSPSSGDNEPHIWAPAAVPVPAFLKSLLEYFTEPVSQITKFLKKITDSIDDIPVTIAGAINNIPVLGNISKAVTSIPDTLTGLPKAIADALPEIPVVEFPSLEGIMSGIDAIPETIRALPKAIADALPAVEFPKIEFPSQDDIVKGIKNLPQAIADALGFELPDFLSPLQNIVKFLNETFLIDSVAINVATNGLTGIWDSKFPIMDKLGNLFNAFLFSDSYTYPVFRMTTPDVLKSFYQHEEIILLDFADYKTQVVWCRNILRGMIWFAFAYYLFKHFEVSFHVG